MNTPLLPVLAAEDEETDRFILERAFQIAELPHPLFIVCDGQEAIDYLSGNSPYHDRAAHPLPALLLLDLKMPRMTGFEVLEWLAARPDYRKLPVVVLSSSSHESDIQRVRKTGARDYIAKPHALSDWVKIMQAVQARWLTNPPAAATAFAVPAAGRPCLKSGDE